MPSQKTIFTEMGVHKLKPPPEGRQKDYFQKLTRGLTLMLRLSYGGTKSWRIVTYERGRARVRTLGHYPQMSVAKATKAAFAFDPQKAKAAATAGSFREVAEEWLRGHVDKQHLRSKPAILRQLKRYIYPEWATTPFFDIRRLAVNKLLDHVERKGGAPMADSVLATVRSIMGWYETRTENYDSPIKKGMNRDKREAHEKARSRILNDQEIRDVWAAAADSGSFGAIVKLLLLTAQRREKVATMKWSDIKDGTWTIATENREKGNAGSLKLPALAIEIIASQNMVDDNPYVFPGDARRRRKTADRSRPACFSAWAQRKAQLDARLPSMEKWVVHDLRRTARSLTARAGVGNDIAERVLGHRIAGVQGIYNRHDYEDEKADALRRLAALIDQIINPPDKSNVVAFPTAAGVEAVAGSAV